MSDALLSYFECKYKCSIDRSLLSEFKGETVFIVSVNVLSELVSRCRIDRLIP
jgi:hypothetical protein